MTLARLLTPASTLLILLLSLGTQSVQGASRVGNVLNILSGEQIQVIFPDGQRRQLNNHRLKAGGLVFRTESPDTGQKTRLGLRSKIVVYFGLKMMLQIVFDHLFSQFSRGAVVLTFARDE
jgi:hypothetical protein